jgi:hypothetical protein
MPTAIDSLYASSLTLRLLCAKNASLVLGFFNEAFKERNQHAIGEEELELLLERHLADHVVLDGEMPAENRAKNYLNHWCSNDYCYIRGCQTAGARAHSSRIFERDNPSCHWRIAIDRLWDCWT